MSYDPTNYRRRDVEALEHELDHVFDVLRQIRGAVALTGRPVSELQILELGPGSDFGAQLLIASEGAEVTLCDRFLARWDPDYHPQFYRRLAERYDGPREQLEAVIAAGDHRASSLRLLEEPAENLVSVESGSIDLLYSFAVLEHIIDINAIAHEMARVSAVGAHGFHLIDLRYHRDFGRPLEHLTWDDARFQQAAEAVDFDFGNRWRAQEFAAHFEQAGLRVTGRDILECAAESYVSDAIARLRTSASSYRAWPAEDLKRVVVAFSLRRIGEPDASWMAMRAADALDMIGALKAEAHRSPVPNADADWAETLLDPAGFDPEQGHAWIHQLADIQPGDTIEEAYASSLELWEDEQLLGPPHTSHSDIRARGLGRFSHWGRQLFMSTSDNTSPLENGRTYKVRVRRSPASRP